MNQQDLDSNRHFRLFAVSVERAIAKYRYTPETDITEMQKAQVEKLIDLEVKWREALISDPRGEVVYSSFISYIMDERRNTLTARPFFRERQKRFTTNISPALKSRDIGAVQKFHINWTFVRFATKILGESPSEVRTLTKAIEKARMELVEMNLPLAISRSRIFWSRTQKSHLSFMDFVSIATEGLLSAIDKFELPYSPVFRSVAIGRMVGNFIKSYSDTMLHFYPNDRRKIYRANKYLSKRPDGDYETSDLVDAVNIGATSKQRTSDQEIKALCSAISVLPFEVKSENSSSFRDEPEQDISSKMAAPSDCRPDVRFERTQSAKSVQDALLDLTLVDRKLLRLKGVDLNSISW